MHSPMQILACAAASTWVLYRLRTFLFHRLYGNCLLLHFLPGLRLALFQLVYVPADAEHDADVRTVDKGRSTALADKRKRLARDRHDAYSHQHVEHGLRHQEEADTHDEEGIIGLVTIAGDAPDAHQEPNVKESDKVKLFNALNNAEASLSDMVGQAIPIIGYFVQEKEDLDEKTGEIKVRKIITVIDDSGKAYATNSNSFIDAMNLAKQVFNYDWNEKPLVITPIQKKSFSSNNKYLTFVVNE